MYYEIDGKKFKMHIKTKNSRIVYIIYSLDKIQIKNERYSLD